MFSKFPVSTDNHTVFYEECLKTVATYPSNSWIDPILPNEEYTLGALCENFATLFGLMKEEKEKGVNVDFEYTLIKAETLL